MDKDLFLICECKNIEHLVRFTRFEDMMFMEVHLVKLPFWKRVIHAIKYIFGYKCRYGDFDEFIFQSTDWDKLQDIANELKAIYDSESNFK